MFYLQCATSKRFLVSLQFEKESLNYPESETNFADLFKKIEEIR